MSYGLDLQLSSRILDLAGVKSAPWVWQTCLTHIIYVWQTCLTHVYLDLANMSTHITMDVANRQT
jgi:hypothetical protein